MEVLWESEAGAIILLWSTNDRVLKIFSFLFKISSTAENSQMKIPQGSVFSLTQSLIPVHFPGLCCQTILLFNIYQMVVAPGIWKTHKTLSFPWHLYHPKAQPVMTLWFWGHSGEGPLSMGQTPSLPGGEEGIHGKKLQSLLTGGIRIGLAITDLCCLFLLIAWFSWCINQSFWEKQIWCKIHKYVRLYKPGLQWLPVEQVRRRARGLCSCGGLKVPA